MFLTRFFERGRPQYNIADMVDDDVWEDVLGEHMRSDAGQRVNESSALSLSPVWGSVAMISGGCAKIPAKIYRRRQPGPGKDVDWNHQAARYISIDDYANDETPALDLLRRCYVSALLYSNGYIWCDWTSSGELLGLYNLCPDRTGTMRHKGRLWYVTEVNGELYPLHPDDMIHLSGLKHHAGDAPSLIKAARHDIGLQLAARKFTSKFFANGAHLGGVLQLPPGYDPKTRAKYERALEEQRTGADKAFKSFVMAEGYKFFSTTVDPQKAQTTELNDEKRRDVANWFSMNPSRLGVKGSVSYNSQEHDKQDFYDTTLSNWLIPMQAQFNCKLLSPRERRDRTHVVRFQVSALLWTDAKTQNDIAVSGISAGRFTPDETRDWADMNPRADGQGGKALVPLNMTLAGDEPAADDSAAPPADDASARSAELRAALAKLLDTTLRRIGKRLATQAERASKANRLDTWLESLEAEQRDTLVEMLDDVLPAIRAAGLGDSASIDVADVCIAAARLHASESEPFDTFTAVLAETAAAVFLEQPA